MSIKHFSLSDFTDVAKDILKNNKFLGIPEADKLDANSSFREVLDITSLEIAELMVEIEARYHVNMEWAETSGIDNIKDVYDVFVKSIAIMRKPKIATPVHQR